MNKPIIAILAASAFVVCSSASAQVQMEGTSRIVTDTIHSKILCAPRAYTVYLPASFDTHPERTYPILYLLHGLWGNNSDWAKDGQLRGTADLLMRSGEADEMIIVTPDADTGNGPDVQCGYFNIPGWRYEDFFFEEFMPQIESKYRVIGDSKHRAIAGLSMGGGGSVVYVQHHPDMFAACYPMSAAVSHRPKNEPSVPQGDNKFTRWRKSMVENDAIEFVRNADEATRRNLSNIGWMIDCGDDDFLLDVNVEFYQAMRDAAIPAELRVRDGIHDWTYWTGALHTCLPFVTRNFKK